MLWMIPKGRRKVVFECRTVSSMSKKRMVVRHRKTPVRSSAPAAVSCDTAKDGYVILAAELVRCLGGRMETGGVRRSDRVSLTLLLEVSGFDSQGQEFNSPARTLQINRNGAVILLDHDLKADQRMIMQRRAPSESAAEAKCAWWDSLDARKTATYTEWKSPIRQSICGEWNFLQSPNPRKRWRECFWSAPPARAAKWCT